MALPSCFIESALRNEEATNPADLTEDFQHYTRRFSEQVFLSVFPTELSISTYWK